MSYLNKLYETYNYIASSEKATRVNNPLIPICNSTQNAQVTVIIDDLGDFVTASTISKEDARTIIPVTINSAARTSGRVPHPLFDQLPYLAGDLKEYHTLDKGEDLYTIFFKPYMSQLKRWVEFENSPSYLKVIYNYLEKERLTKDLVECGVLELDDEGRLIEKKINSVDQSKYFIRFSLMDGLRKIDLWKDQNLHKAYAEYYLSSLDKEKKGLCYISGKESYISDKHGKFIRNAGDGAKLISSNDERFFTYRGRFLAADQSAQISYEVSEKAHAALRWLIKEQSFHRDGLVVLAWNKEGHPIPQPFSSTEQLHDKLTDMGEESDYILKESIDLGSKFSHEFNKAMGGYKHNLKGGEKVALISLDAATTGRLSVIYYNEVDNQEYFKKLENWHSGAAWKQVKKKTKEGEEKDEYLEFVGAPSTIDIVTYAFGSEVNEKMQVDDKLFKLQLRRMLPCIISGKTVPIDIVNNLLRQASRPMAKNNYNWQRTLSIACSMIKKRKIDIEGVDLGMALNVNEKDRSYLFGRLLAVADYTESIYLAIKNLDRMTGAKRSMEAFSKNPFRVWKRIYERQSPFLASLPKKRRQFLQFQIQGIMDLFEGNDYSLAKPLNGMYLLGFSHQLNELYKKDSKETKKAESEENDIELIDKQ